MSSRLGRRLAKEYWKDKSSFEYEIIPSMKKNSLDMSDDDRKIAGDMWEEWRMTRQ